jgi:hypothetical protein
MVMGFNTDIKHEGVMFHIQTEPRKDAAIETTVYLQGAVIHKLLGTFEDLLASSDDPGDEKVRRRLEDQHRQVIARIRAGEIKPSAHPTGPA